MDKLIVGIDLTNEYCQVCYYNHRHGRPESVAFGTTAPSLQIAVAVTYDVDEGRWLIGENAEKHSEKTGSFLFRDIVKGMLEGETMSIDGVTHTYHHLVAIFLRRVMEIVQIRSGLMNVGKIVLAMRKVNADVKEAVGKVMSELDLESGDVKLISYAESFAYFVLNEDSGRWRDGALLFDFETDGMFSKQLTVQGTYDRMLFFINEKNHMDFTVNDLASDIARMDMDRKLGSIYEEVRLTGDRCSVYFTGSGFRELWFSNTLTKISSECRVFQGNNIYVTGACLAGVVISGGNGDYRIICKGRTRASISVGVRARGQMCMEELSPAACDWFDAGCTRDYILTGDRKAEFFVTALIGQEQTPVEFDLSTFPERKEKATRVRVEVKYVNEYECEIKVKDIGFGTFFEGSGKELIKRLNLEGYI